MPEVIFENKSGLVLIEGSVVDTLNRWRQHGQQKEAGGILLGFKRPPHLHITACTTPFSRDKRSYLHFFRRDPRHVFFARRLWSQSRGHIYYLGGWHTHPVEIPCPSRLDKREWRKLIKSSLGPQLLFVIIGRKQWYVQCDDAPLETVHTQYIHQF